MRKLVSLIRLNLISSLIERADMLLYTISNCAAPLIILFVWLSFIPPGQSSVFSHDQLILYFLLVTFVKLITSAWGGFFLSARIRRGAISPFLTQPTPYFFHYISNNIAKKIIKLLMLTPILIFLTYLFQPAFPSITPVNLLVSLVSLFFAAVLFFIMDIILGLLSFWFKFSAPHFYFSQFTDSGSLPSATTPPPHHNSDHYYIDNIAHS